jgi:hypothetical protein
MDPETDIETRTDTDRPRRASRAPWDPPARPPKPSVVRRRKADAAEPAVLGGYYDDPGRGFD